MMLIGEQGERRQLNNSSFLIGGGTVVLPDRLLEGGWLLVEDGRIVSVADSPPPGSGSLPFIDAGGGYIAPALVELHIHGCGEHSFETVDAAGFQAAADFLLQRGVSAFCPTLQSDEEAVRRLAGILAERPGDGPAAGLYVEGPFVCPEKRGGILPGFLSQPDPATLDRYLADARGQLRLMTIAPELPGAGKLLERCGRRGVLPCLGHSSAATAEALEAAHRFLSAGSERRLGMTHLFNGMSPISHKRSGLAALPFLSPEPFVEVNGDGVHVNEETLQLCYRCLNRDKLILISDAVISAGLPSERAAAGDLTYFGKPVVSGAEGVRFRRDGTLVGSNRLLPEVLRHFIRATGAPLWEAVRFASLNPCRFLGIAESRGSLEAGKRAEVIIMDGEYRVRRVLASSS